MFNTGPDTHTHTQTKKSPGMVSERGVMVLPLTKSKKTNSVRNTLFLYVGYSSEVSSTPFQCHCGRQPGTLPLHPTSVFVFESPPHPSLKVRLNVPRFSSHQPRRSENEHIAQFSSNNMRTPCKPGYSVCNSNVHTVPEDSKRRHIKGGGGATISALLMRSRNTCCANHRRAIGQAVLYKHRLTCSPFYDASRNQRVALYSGTNTGAHIHRDKNTIGFRLLDIDFRTLRMTNTAPPQLVGSTASKKWRETQIMHNRKASSMNNGLYYKLLEGDDSYKQEYST